MPLNMDLKTLKICYENKIFGINFATGTEKIVSSIFD